MLHGFDVMNDVSPEAPVAILRVAQIGHPVLRFVAEPVDPSVIPTPDFQRLCDDMLATLDEYDGAGLAAPQVHVSARIAVVTLDDDRGPEFLINPVITPLTDTEVRTVEGCLSIEGFRAVVHRPGHVRVDALGRDGHPVALELTGMPAVIVQHECDHLDGVLYVDRADLSTLARLGEYRRWGALDRLPLGPQDDEEEEELDLDMFDEVIELSTAEVA